MAGEKNAGSIVYEISADVEPLLQGGKQAIDALDKLDAAAQQSGKGMDTLDQSASQTGSAFTELAGYANSMDNQLRKLNTSVSGIARAMEEARAGTGSTTSEFSRANAVIESLGNQVAILEEAQQNGARSAAVFASQLRAGSSATEEEKRTIADLAGAFYDLKASSDEAAKSASSIAAATQRAESSISGLEKEVSILNTEMQAGSRSAAVLAAQLSAGEGASDAQKAKITQLAGALFDMREAQKSASTASAEAAKQLAQQANEANRISGITSDLSNQIAILSEQQTNGARSAAILSAQLRAGASATEADKQKIGELTGQLFDMKRTTDVATGGSKNWKSSMQQAGYQVQDFIVQVQGGQSALVAFSQQGSQLAGAFGPGGAVVGAIIALSTVVAGTLVASLSNGKSAVDSLKDAIETTDKVISISQNGVGALSDKYAALARVNIQVATLMRKQAELELQSALAKVSVEVQKASKDFIGFGDSIVSSLGGGYASVKLFNDYLSTLSITTDDWGQAMKQAATSGQAGQTAMQSMIATVGALAGKFDLTDQQAYEFAKQLSDISKNPSDEKLNSLIAKLQEFGVGASKGAGTAQKYADKLLQIVSSSADATMRLKALKEMTDSLTSSQDKALRVAQQELYISRQSGDAQMKAKAWRDAETQGLKEGTEAFRKYYNVRLATYRQDEANVSSKKGAKSAATEANKLANQQESVAQKLANLKQQSELAADSTNNLSREQAILNAQQSLGKGATTEQIALAGKYAAAKWDTANALKAQAAAAKLIPEVRENASYKQDVEDLNAALAAKTISQEQFGKASERLEATHQANLAKIRSQQAVTPQQESAGMVDPVQQLANQHVQQLALIQQFEQQGVLTHQNALALKNAADTEYEQQRIAAQWEIYRNQSQANELLAASVDGLQSGATNAITGLINGTQSLQEAFANVGTTILGSVVGSLVEMGMQWAKSQLMGQAAAAASLASTMAQATAAASAWAPAAISASIATMGSAAAVGQSAYAGSLLSAKGMAIAGARYNGGSVSANSMYQVGENGKPEIYQASNGSQYMIPGDNGRVISNRDVQGGGSGGAVIQQEVHFHIETTGGIDDATMAKMSQMMKQVSLSTIRDQQRPNGLLRR
ncbi:tail protein (tape measure) [Kluyvera ascorbata]|uniref:tail protein (tape measure) n=1 Tax=Kluyvera ascorbata TaxID=51288 RepID=UPI003510C079